MCRTSLGIQGWLKALLSTGCQFRLLSVSVWCVAPGSFDGCHAGQQPGGGAQERCAERLHPRAADQQRQAGSVRCKAAQSTWGTHANSPEVNTLLRRCAHVCRCFCPSDCAFVLATCLQTLVQRPRHRAGCPAPGRGPQVPGSMRQTGVRPHPRMRTAAGRRAGRPPHCLRGAQPRQTDLQHTKTGIGQGLCIIRQQYGTKGEQCFMACRLCNSQHAAGCCSVLQGHLGEQSHEQCSLPR